VALGFLHTDGYNPIDSSWHSRSKRHIERALRSGGEGAATTTGAGGGDCVLAAHGDDRVAGRAQMIGQLYGLLPLVVPTDCAAKVKLPAEAANSGRTSCAHYVVNLRADAASVGDRDCSR
jgi:hypothetical protein